MGLAASQARALALMARRSDLELAAQQIAQSRQQLANITNQLFTLSSNLDPNSPQVHVLQMRISAIQGLDKSLELQMKRVDTQRNSIVAEYDGLLKLIGKNIELGFKYMG